MLKAGEISEIIKRQLAGYESEVDLQEVGRVIEVGDGIELARDNVYLVALSGELEERLRVGTADGRRGLHLVADLGDRVGDDASMILVTQAPAHELLGDRGRQVSDLAPELLARPPHVGVHLRLRRLHESL